jgi:hypothetical protein
MITTRSTGWHALRRSWQIEHIASRASDTVPVAVSDAVSGVVEHVARTLIGAESTEVLDVSATQTRAAAASGVAIWLTTVTVTTVTYG